MSTPEFIQAFPSEGGEQSGLHPSPGMSLRDWFAGQALIMLPHHGCGADLDQLETAKAAYQLADAMIAARKEVK